MPPQPMLDRSHYVFTLSVATSVPSLSIPYFVSLYKNNEKFAGNSHTTNRLSITFWTKLEQEQGNRIREKIRIDVNRF